MNFSLSMNSREVLFHLNYMGYKNVTAEQLKNFMIGNSYFQIIRSFNFSIVPFSNFQI